MLVFYHGGYMVSGNKQMLLPGLKTGCQRRKWLLLSVDYHFLPECSGLDINLYPDSIADIDGLSKKIKTMVKM